MLIGFACSTALIWIKLFFLMPYKETDPNLTAFESSVFGQFCNKEQAVSCDLDEKSAEKNEESEKNEEKNESIPLMNSILTVNYLLVRVLTKNLRPQMMLELKKTRKQQIFSM